MQQYFSKKREKDILYLNEEDLHHIKNVMRFKPGTKLIVNYDGVSYKIFQPDTAYRLCRHGLRAHLLSMQKKQKLFPFSDRMRHCLRDTICSAKIMGGHAFKYFQHHARRHFCAWR